MLVEAIFEQALLYDPIPYDESPKEELPPLIAWFQQDPDRWRVSRSDSANVRGLVGQIAFKFVGERGVGKTTALCKALDDASSDFIKFYLDFDHAPTLAPGMCRPDEVARSVAKHMRNKIDVCVNNSDLRRAFRASYIREIVRNQGHHCLVDIKEKYFDSLSDLDDSFLIDSSEIKEAMRIFETQLSTVEDVDLRFRALQQIPHRRLLLAVDNVDHLGPNRIEAIFGFLASSLRSDSILYIGLRSEHEELARAPFSAMRTHTVRLQNDRAFFKIANQRINSAYKYVAEKHPELSKVAESHQVELLRAVDAIETDDVSANLFQDWHNGSVRQMSIFVRNNSRDLADRKGYSKQTRGFLYEQLVRANGDHLLRILEPRHIRCKGTKFKFVFLRLRILAYLRDRDGTVPVSTLEHDFESNFGVPTSKIDDAIKDLSGQGDGALVRRLSDYLPIQQLDIQDQLILLPAGNRFITEMLYSCHYLSLLYDMRGNLPEIDIAPMKDAEILLEKSSIVVDRIVLAALKEEHPYLGVRRNVTREERERLNAYCDTFDYGVGRWLVSRILEELTGFAKDRRVETKTWLEVRAKMRRMINHLNQIVESSDSLR